MRASTSVGQALSVVFPVLSAVAVVAMIVAQSAGRQQTAGGLGGQSVFTDYRGERPGQTHRITVADLPPPGQTESVDNPPEVVPRPQNARPQALEGFRVNLYAGGLYRPRLIRTAPNGDLFVAESDAGRILVLRGLNRNGEFEQKEVFASGLKRPFGIAFYPPGANPHWVYIGATDAVLRFPYENGELKARTQPQQITQLPSGAGHLGGGGHWTRDIVFSADGNKMFVSVGSYSNDDDTDDNPRERYRADILEYNPDGSGFSVYAYGLRNAVTMDIQPETGELWASVNERDTLGDNLPPDYISHIQQGGFYGWPWYYTGGNPDPHHKGKHPELREKAIVPDVLLQPHTAPLGMTFYRGRQFPSQYRGDIFIASHGSWNRSKRTGYEVIRVPLKNSKTTGEYEDFLTGFVTPQGEIWGRPVAIAVAQDGSLLVSDDASNSIWRVTYIGAQDSGH